MLRRAIGHNSRGLLQWHLIVTQVREYRWTEIDPGVHTREGEHPLEAMMHWHVPAERLEPFAAGGNLFSTITRRRVEGFRFATCGAHRTRCGSGASGLRHAR